MAPNEQRSCVVCEQPLPMKSKFAQAEISRDEAERHGWQGETNAKDTVTVPMCLQCQIDRSKAQK
jgi:hypothetical protein